DRAVVAAQAALARWPADRPPHPLLRLYLAEAYHQRWLVREADEHEADDLAAGIAAWTDVLDGGGDAWAMGGALGQAEHRLGRLRDDGDTLLAAADHLDRALAGDVPPDDRLLGLHNDRMQAEWALADGGLARLAPGAPPGQNGDSLRRTLME